ncbi:MAG: 50S ribosomal protein L11 methyltransferase [Chitinophagaceae bacterium]|nr:MAG: 50S ribosomal protein L11 methyltransferase [Chitinophagaceae bacterium]
MRKPSYIVVFKPVSDEQSEVLAAFCFECGAEGVSEDEDTLTASFPEHPENINEWDMVLSFCEENNIPITVRKQEWVNWNAEWEKNFQAIDIGKNIHVRAPFHNHSQKHFDIVIEPKMAFGTGHHATTAMVMKIMTEIDFSGKSVLDYGCGSGILSILAAKLNASSIIALDYDINSVENCIANFKLNSVVNGEVRHGDKAAIPDMNFDIILANINKNVILDSFSELSERLEKGAHLIISGILSEDIEKIISVANQFSLRLIKQNTENNWAVLLFSKNSV